MKQKILILGAGRAATALIDYLLNEAVKNDWFVTVADFDGDLAKQKVGNASNGKAVQLNIKNTSKRRALIQAVDIVVSLLPVNLHYLVVKDCLKYKKHIVTASYLSQEMYGLDREAREAAIVMVGEMGLDPGIDHMSAMEKIDALRADDCKITAFRSFTGGLVSKDNLQNNPWNYKFTWNPRNVVLAGQGTAQYMSEGKYKYIPYNRVFQRLDEIHVDGIGKLEAYVNRDSLLYKTLYHLEDIPTLIRYTLRYPGYCRAWNALVKLGWTDDTYPIIDSELMTYRDLLESYLRGVFKTYPSGYNLRHHLADFLRMDRSDPIMGKLEWLGIFDRTPIKIKNASPAMILQDLLMKKWALQTDDQDLIVMQHQFDYEKEGKNYRLISTMKMFGTDSVHTAMSKLVGLPIGIFVKLILQEKLKLRGVHIPVIPEIYAPVLAELAGLGVVFDDQIQELRLND